MAFPAGVGFVEIIPKTDKFAATLTQSLTKGVGGVGQSLGKSLSSAITSPLGILGGAAVVGAIGKMTVGFEDAFTRIRSLSNASTQDISKWKDEVLSLAGETAQAPQELADALFFLSSAGLEASQIMPTLEASAKGAAVGLGTTADVANITASALNAYAKTGLTAAQVTDTLVAAVREGRAEPEEFAKALGRILPIASTIGVTFQDVTASLAALSNIGLDVNEGVTAMRGVLQAVAAPGTLAAKALGELGLSAQDLLDAIKQDGLIGALRLLDTAAKDQTNTQADYIGVLRKVIPNVRSLTGDLGLLTQDANKVDDIFDRVNNSTGSLAEAFKSTTEGPGFQLRQFMTELSTVAIQLGETGLPVVTTALKALGPVLSFAADNASLLLGVFISYKTIGFVQGLLTGIAEAQAAQAATAHLAAVANAEAAASIGVSAAAYAETAGAATLAATATKGATVATTLLGGAMARNLPQVVALALAVKAAVHELTAFKAGDWGGAANAIGEGFKLIGVNLPHVQDAADIQKVQGAVNGLRTEMDNAKVSAEAQAAAFRAGFEAVGHLTPDNVEEFTAAVKASAQQTQGWASASAFAAEKAKEEEDALRAATAATFAHARGLNDIVEAIGPVPGLFAEMSTTAADFAAQARTALRTDKWKEFAKTVREDATKALEDFQDTAFQALSFSGDALAKVTEDGKATAEQILKAFQTATDKTKSFGQDLLEVARIGGGAGKDLARSLLESGDVIAAQVIANAPGKLGEQIVTAFGKGQGAAEDLANRLTEKLLGTMQDIEDILKAIAKQWNIRIKVDTTGANEKITELQGRLLDVGGQTIVIDVGGRKRVSGVQTGGITQGSVFQFGEGASATFAGKGAEAIIPLNERGIGILSQALQRAIGKGHDHSTGDAELLREVRGLRTDIRGLEMRVDGEKLGQVVTRSQHRRRTLVTV